MAGFGQRVTKCRRAKKKSLSEMSRELGISKVSLAAYEKNKMEPPYEVLIMLVQYFNVTADYLLGLSNKA
ncbi:MAG TPA: helix-turn-helix transcriptional regulator [Candidatus Scatavimonas merdigallinarum]|uniref:Helix-turn-helix transcriptional regulator n=1 Tax=Candidatus Scatavimonas merdigallinarum TaxID=2840914 RepID=A0A9D0ZHH6_9FIRM|nr:helix-turn-helix transcriptional regulator [Candidatus Scatavimonas merdigallinarum]